MSQTVESLMKVGQRVFSDDTSGKQLLWALVAAFEQREDKRGQRFVLHVPDEEADLDPFTPREKLGRSL